MIPVHPVKASRMFIRQETDKCNLDLHVKNQ